MDNLKLVHEVLPMDRQTVGVQRNTTLDKHTLSHNYIYIVFVIHIIHYIRRFFLVNLPTLLAEFL